MTGVIDGLAAWGERWVEVTPDRSDPGFAQWAWCQVQLDRSALPAGRVVVARDLYFTGNTLIIDHGLGLVSLLAHLSRIDVHEGDEVAGGQIVGLVGATGRVTGPHLHWTLSVSGARVDPLSLLVLLGEESSSRR